MAFTEEEKNELELTLFRALRKYNQEKEEELDKRFKLQMEICPAQRGYSAMRWLMSLPIITIIGTAIYHWLNRKNQ